MKSSLFYTCEEYMSFREDAKQEMRERMLQQLRERYGIQTMDDARMLYCRVVQLQQLQQNQQQNQQQKVAIAVPSLPVHSTSEMVPVIPPPMPLKRPIIAIRPVEDDSQQTERPCKRVRRSVAVP